MFQIYQYFIQLIHTTYSDAVLQFHVVNSNTKDKLS